MEKACIMSLCYPVWTCATGVSDLVMGWGLRGDKGGDGGSLLSTHLM